MPEKNNANKSIAWLLLVPIIIGLVYGINNYSAVKKAEPRKIVKNTQKKTPAKKQIIKKVALREVPLVKAEKKTEPRAEEEPDEPAKTPKKTSKNEKSASSVTPKQKKPAPKPKQEETKKEASSSLVKVTLSINKGSGQKAYPTEVATGSVVFDVLKTASLKYHFSMDYKNYAYGAFIEELDGVRSDKSQAMYWIYYINGKKANLGASSQKVKEGDNILWKYEKEE